MAYMKDSEAYPLDFGPQKRNPFLVGLCPDGEGNVDLTLDIRNHSVVIDDQDYLSFGHLHVPVTVLLDEYVSQVAEFEEYGGNGKLMAQKLRDYANRIEQALAHADRACEPRTEPSELLATG